MNEKPRKCCARMRKREETERKRENGGWKREGEKGKLQKRGKLIPKRTGS